MSSEPETLQYLLPLTLKDYTDVLDIKKDHSCRGGYSDVYCVGRRGKKKVFAVKSIIHEDAHHREHVEV